MTIPKEGLHYDNRWYPPSSLKAATADDYKQLNEALTYLRNQGRVEPEEKKDEEKEVPAKSTSEIVNHNRNLAHFGSQDASSDIIAAFEKQMMIVSMMKAFRTQNAKSERTHQEKEVEKTKECMELHRRIIAKKIVNEEIDKHTINAKIIDYKVMN